MNSKLFLFLIVFAISSSSYSQQTKVWDSWNWLIGEWIGEGSGQPGQGGGTFSFSLDLNNKIMVNKSHSEYPATENKPAIIHESMMITSLDYKGTPSKAVYYDNEGHTINYQITYEDKSIVFTSEKIPNTPIFRLTYTELNPQVVNTKFEMSQDGLNFMNYIEGKSKRKN
jgi:hypothetical protein